MESEEVGRGGGGSVMIMCDVLQYFKLICAPPPSYLLYWSSNILFSTPLRFWNEAKVVAES